MKHFPKLLQELVSDPKYSKFMGSNDDPQQKVILNMMIASQSEELKQTFGQYKQEEYTIMLAREFVKVYEKTLEENVKKIDEAEYKDGILCIKKAVIESKIFGPVIEEATTCITTYLDEEFKKHDNQHTTFYLAGGFGRCEYVHQKVNKAVSTFYQEKGKYDSKCEMACPTPELAVIQGAVTWHKNQQKKMMKRKADATYGIAISPVFEPKKHDEHYRFYHEEDRKYRCHSVYSVYVEKGETLNPEEVYTTQLIPHSQKDTQATISIYSTPNIGVQYTVDKSGKPKATKIGEVIINIPNPCNLPKNDRKFTITMDFSGTEIKAKAKYQVTGEEVNIVCNFLSA